MDVGAVLASGLAAGLAVAMPLGPVGVLLLREGVQRGPRDAWPAATGVALVDTLYCLLAATVGAAASPFIDSLGVWPGVIGGSALLLIAASGLWRGTVGGTRTAPGSPADATPPPLGAGTGTGGPARFLTFVGLTLVNPATLVYFAALVAGLPQVAGDATSVLVFVAAVGLASLAWQVLLVCAGGILHRRAGPGLQRVTVVAGNSVVAVLGAGILLDALG
ncbi:LysE family transporter [Actinomyces sp.]|uniref:LysE family transporter n=1 Tax=Actinomyces sp. TaxID=29317 RepID=UPI0028A2AFA9|nr:LysE family transporter [Actinomyces sp.]